MFILTETHVGKEKKVLVDLFICIHNAFSSLDCKPHGGGISCFVKEDIYNIIEKIDINEENAIKLAQQESILYLVFIYHQLIHCILII